MMKMINWDKIIYSVTFILQKNSFSSKFCVHVTLIKKKGKIKYPFFFS